jgi:hypothetical protein
MQSIIVRHVRHCTSILAPEENFFHPGVTRKFKDNSYTVMLGKETKLQVWVLTSDKSLNMALKNNVLLAPPIAFDGIHPSITIKTLTDIDSQQLQNGSQDIDTKFFRNCHGSLQTIFEMHITDTFNYTDHSTIDEYAFKTKFLTVLSVVMAMNLHKTHTNLKALQGFDECFKHINQICSQEEVSILQQIYAEGYERCNNFIKEHNITKDLAAEATRLLSLSGACIVSQLAQDTPYSKHTILSSMISPAVLRKNFFTSFEEVVAFAKQSRNECIHMISNANLHGERIIQDFLDIKMLSEDNDTCAVCSSTIECNDIVVGDCKTCIDCNRMLCNKCTKCTCPSVSAKSCMHGLFKQWNVCQEATTKSEKLLNDLEKTKKQNEALCRKNIEGAKKAEESERKLCLSQYTMDSLTTEKKEMKSELKKMSKENKQLVQHRTLAENALILEKQTAQREKHIAAVQIESLKHSIRDLDTDNNSSAHLQYDICCEQERIHKQTQKAMLDEHMLALKTIQAEAKAVAEASKQELAEKDALIHTLKKSMATSENEWQKKLSEMQQEHEKLKQKLNMQVKETTTVSTSTCIRTSEACTSTEDATEYATKDSQKNEMEERIQRLEFALSSEQQKSRSHGCEMQSTEYANIQQTQTHGMHPRLHNEMHHHGMHHEMHGGPMFNHHPQYHAQHHTPHHPPYHTQHHPMHNPVQFIPAQYMQNAYV